MFVWKSRDRSSVTDSRRYNRGASDWPAPCPNFFNVTKISLLDKPSIAYAMDALLPKPIAQALAVVGLLYLSSKVWSFLRLLASLFILPGQSVRRAPPRSYPN